MYVAALAVVGHVVGLTWRCSLKEDIQCSAHSFSQKSFFLTMGRSQKVCCTELTNITLISKVNILYNFGSEVVNPTF